MIVIDAYEAKTHLLRLLDDVAQGATIIITKRGKPVARLGPYGEASYAEAKREERRQAIAALRTLARSAPAWEGVSYRDLIDAGHRF